MRTPSEIRAEIDRESERRANLWRSLGSGHGASVAAELKSVDERLVALWEEHRLTKARLRFGDRDRIITRARAEERLERAA
jgi:hypothetical protein